MSEILNPKTNRFVKIGSQGYKRLVREGTIQAVEPVETKAKPIPIKRELTPEPEPEFDEAKFQSKLAEISTDMIQKNMKKIVKNQQLSDKELDMMLKKMLYKKLVLEQLKPLTKAVKKKKSKFKLVEPSSSESESD